MGAVLPEESVFLRTQTFPAAPFKFYYVAEVPNVAKVEKALHEGFAEHRINPKREFFKMNPEQVIAMLQMVDPKPLDLNRLESPATEEDKRGRRNCAKYQSHFY